MTLRCCRLLLAFWAVSLSCPLVALAQKPTASSGAEGGKSRATKDPVERVAFEHALSAEQVKELEGKTVTLLMRNGDEEKEVVIKKFITGKEPDRFRSIEVLLNGKTTRKINGDKLFEIEHESVSYPLSYLPAQRMYVLDDAAARHQETAERLKAIQAQSRVDFDFWEPISEARLAEHIAEQKAFLNKVGQHFSRLPMQLHETKYFLFYTDMPAGQAAPFITQLDKMYEFLGQAFGIKPGTNIWQGKSPVVCFINKADFVEFEFKFMENADASGAQGLCHQDTSGKVLTSCYRGENPDFFAAVLVHETAHGYVHRFRTSIFVPTWANEGIAEWVAAAIVPKEGKAGEIGRRQRAGAELVRRSGRLGTFYDLQGLNRDQYGIASSMVELLIKLNPEQFKLFFNGIKDGLKWEDSLTRAYGFTRADLTTLYGRSIGMPNLTE